MDNIRRKTKKALTCLLGLALILGHFSGIGAWAAVADTEERIQPFDNTWELCERRDWVIPGRTSLTSVQSGITLPYRRLSASERAVWIAEYWEMGGPVAFELEVMRLINEVRIANGRSPVQPDRTLLMAARFHAQIMASFGVEGNWSHHVGPYSVDGRGASGNLAQAFGANLSPWTGGNGGVIWSTANNLREDSPERQVQNWLNSPGHCRLILDHAHRYVGAGTHIGNGWSDHPSQSNVLNYLFFSRIPSLPRYPATVEQGVIATVLGAIPIGEFLAGETVEISAVIPAGSQFARWEGPPSVTFAGVTNRNTTFAMPAGNVTVRAINELIPAVTYTITFNANNGINAPNPQIKTHGTDLVLTSSVPTRTGYRFLGWATSATATVAEYQSGAVFTRNANTTLFAVWQPLGSCQAIATGRFANQPGVNGVAGAPWVLCDNGVLEVGTGYIDWREFISPWDAYRADITSIEFTGPITTGTSLNHLFARLSYVTTIKGLENFDTSRVWNMTGMFNEMHRLTSLDVSSFNTSRVTNMTRMFGSMRQLTSLDVSTWDTSSVTNMTGMFAETSQLATLDVSHFDTSRVTHMGGVFSASGMTNLDLSSWNTSGVTNMSHIFSFTNMTNLNVSTWDTSRVTEFSSAFMHANIADLDISNWNTSNVRNMAHMFHGAQTENLDILSWNTRNVTNMAHMFHGAQIENLDISSWNTSHVTDMRSMFSSAQLNSLDVSSWNTSNVTDMRSMFSGIRGLTSLNLANWDTRQVTQIGWMFNDAELTSLDLSGRNWNTSRADMSSMFMGATNLRSLSLGENFVFRGTPRLPEISQTAELTGFWQNVGSGTASHPTGTRVFTSTQLMSQFNGRTMADTFVWQPTR